MDLVELLDRTAGQVGEPVLRGNAQGCERFLNTAFSLKPGIAGAGNSPGINHRVASHECLNSCFVSVEQKVPVALPRKPYPDESKAEKATSVLFL